MIRCDQKTARTHDQLSSWHLSSPKVISQPMTALAHTSESDCRTRTTSERYTANESWTRTKYAYVLNDPVNLLDLSGMCPCPKAGNAPLPQFFEALAAQSPNWIDNFMNLLDF